mmetsp:Transcript_7433/g.13913  ORF Transcript_7433/g.13913 Transcript_7433/m.13913 type:complete len:257 (-) Transcript_7433:13-783(-)
METSSEGMADHSTRGIYVDNFSSLLMLLFLLVLLVFFTFSSVLIFRMTWIVMALIFIVVNMLFFFFVFFFLVAAGNVTYENHFLNIVVIFVFVIIFVAIITTSILFVGRMIVFRFVSLDIDNITFWSFRSFFRVAFCRFGGVVVVVVVVIVVKMFAIVFVILQWSWFDVLRIMHPLLLCSCRSRCYRQGLFRRRSERSLLLFLLLHPLCWLRFLLLCMLHERRGRGFRSFRVDVVDVIVINVVGFGFGCRQGCREG